MKELKKKTNRVKFPTNLFHHFIHLKNCLQFIPTPILDLIQRCRENTRVLCPTREGRAHPGANRRAMIAFGTSAARVDKGRHPRCWWHHAPEGSSAGTSQADDSVELARLAKWATSAVVSLQ